MSTPGLPRSNVTQPFEGYPAYGAVHDVIPNEQLRNFIVDFSRIADRVFGATHGSERLVIDNRLPEEIAADEAKPEFVDDYDSRGYYKTFDVESLGVNVVEMDPAAKQARALRAVWERQDFGAVEQEARNEIGRRLVGIRPQLLFDRVQGAGHRLPGAGRADVRKKLALLPKEDKFNETIELINGEADLIIDAIKRRLKQFMYPWDVIPHLTFSVFRYEATAEQISTIIGETNDLLREKPVGASLGDLSFRHKKERNGKK